MKTLDRLIHSIVGHKVSKTLKTIKPYQMGPEVTVVSILALTVTIPD